MKTNTISCLKTRVLLQNPVWSFYIHSNVPQLTFQNDMEGKD